MGEGNVTDRLLKILHIIGSADPVYGGPIEGIRLQNEIMKSARGFRHIVSLDSPDAPFLQHAPIKVHPLGERSISNANLSKVFARYGYSSKLLPWLKKHVQGYDLVIVNGLWNYSTFVASRVLPKAGVPYFVFPHGMLDPWFGKKYPLKHLAKQLFWAVCERPLLAHANYVVFTTDEEMVLARSNFWGHSYRSKVVGYGTLAPPRDYRSQEDALLSAVPAIRGRKFILFLSRIHPKKGCDLLLKSFCSIALQHPDIDLVIAGPGHAGLVSSLKKLAAAAGVEHRVHWPGMLTGAAKWGAFRAAEAFILPSHQENFGIAVAESLACNTPVLITNKVNIWREVRSYGAGLVESDDLAGITRLLLQFLALENSERHRMRASAYACYSEKFNMATVCDKIIELASIGDCGQNRRTFLPSSS